MYHKWVELLVVRAAIETVNPTILIAVLMQFQETPIRAAEREIERDVSDNESVSS